jgi:hypothetical protein
MPVDQLSARLRKMRFAPGAIVRCMEKKTLPCPEMPSNGTL